MSPFCRYWQGRAKLAERGFPAAKYLKRHLLLQSERERACRRSLWVAKAHK